MKEGNLWLFMGLNFLLIQESWQMLYISNHEFLNYLMIQVDYNCVKTT